MKENSPVKILLVDDRPENLFALEVILSDTNYQCVKAVSGNEALKILLHEQDFAIILMDVQMPDMDGFETVEIIRESEPLKHVPIIFLTASMDNPVNIFKGYESGAVDYMIKPFSREILKAKVAFFVDLYRKNQQLLFQKEQIRTLNSDMTERIKFEKELIEAKNKAEEAVKSKQQFLSNMSHEIRTPMNAIIGFTKVALRTDLTVKQREYLTAIQVSGDSLIVLINDILDLAKVDAGKMSFEQTPFKISTSIQAILHLFEIKIKEKNLELVKDYDSKIPDIVLGDPVRLHQVILNLLSNAVKFTTKGKITVRVKLLNEDEEKVTIEFSVTDTGIGIPENNIGSIFENFQQASTDTSRLYGGTGLGLAIVKRLIEPQGGTIAVKSELNKGSTFSFILSFPKTEMRAEPEINKWVNPEGELKNVTILVVEDIALNQLLLKTILDDFGFDYDIADNGKKAIEKLSQSDSAVAKKTYDIILMDLQMPEMNGFETTEYIRNTMNSRIPIIALTADVTTVDVEKCRAAGMNDYISKPIDEKLLYSKIIRYLKKPYDIILSGLEK